MKREEVFAVVRRDVTAGHEWVDLGTVSYERDAASRHGRDAKKNNGAWEANNPMVRIARFVMEEVGQQTAGTAPRATGNRR